MNGVNHPLRLSTYRKKSVVHIRLYELKLISFILIHTHTHTLFHTWTINLQIFQGVTQPMYIYKHSHIYTQTYIHTQTRPYICISIYMVVFVYVCCVTLWKFWWLIVHVWMRVFVFVCVYISMRVLMNKSVCVYMHMYKYVCVVKSFDVYVCVYCW